MFILGNLISAIGIILTHAIKIITWLIIIRALISWVNPDPYNIIVQFLYKITEPFLQPFRRIMPVYNIGIDLSPILAILFLWFLDLFVVNTLMDLAVRLR